MQILILANPSGGLYDFRKDLIAALKQHAEVSVAVPHNDRWDELQALADRVIELPIDRRGMNPARDAKLLGQYRAILKRLRSGADLHHQAEHLRRPCLPGAAYSLCRQHHRSRQRDRKRRLAQAVCFDALQAGAGGGKGRVFRKRRKPRHPCSHRCCPARARRGAQRRGCQFGGLSVSALPAGGGGALPLCRARHARKGRGRAVFRGAAAQARVWRRGGVSCCRLV